jgi:hypothetical protein
MRSLIQLVHNQWKYWTRPKPVEVEENLFDKTRREHLPTKHVGLPKIEDEAEPYYIKHPTQFKDDMHKAFHEALKKELL